jgi:DNA polymerase-3 subunit beta
MKFSVKREALLKPLNLVSGVVERRQTLPVLANVLLELDGKQLSLTGTDLEVEIVGRIELELPSESGAVTVPARKFLDICKSLPDGCVIEVTVNEGRAVVKSGRSRFTLSTLPASEFPNVEEGPGSVAFSVLQGQMKRLIDRTSFAMAQQDVRYYLNGMLWEVASDALRMVSTDGHRLALCKLDGEFAVDEKKQVIVPRKGILELNRLLLEEDAEVQISIGLNHIQAMTKDFTFTSKLVDGKFPDYERVLPRGGNKFIFAERQELKQALSRTAILSNEKYRGIRFMLESGNLKVLANNPEQEEAEENVALDYQGESLEIGFNVSYLIDVLGVLSGDTIKITLADANSSALIEEAKDSDSVYVVMPMRL